MTLSRFLSAYQDKEWKKQLSGIYEENGQKTSVHVRLHMAARILIQNIFKGNYEF